MIWEEKKKKKGQLWDPQAMRPPHSSIVIQEVPTHPTSDQTRETTQAGLNQHGPIQKIPNHTNPQTESAEPTPDPFKEPCTLSVIKQVSSEKGSSLFKEILINKTNIKQAARMFRNHMAEEENNITEWMEINEEQTRKRKEGDQDDVVEPTYQSASKKQHQEVSPIFFFFSISLIYWIHAMQ